MSENSPKKKPYSRREFIKQNSLVGAGAVLSMGASPSLFAGYAKKTDEPAVLGGPPVRTTDWPSWPIWNPETDEDRLLEVIRSGVWSRSDTVAEFEATWAETVGAKRCVTTVNGTNALFCSLANLDVGGGDEVIVASFNFISCPLVILQTGAMPVFVDTDPETFQIDVDKIEEKITPRTRAIMPVHICGMPADMIRIMEIAHKHDLVVVEDACQAWKAEINHKQVGTFGHAGCYSFQNSKNITMGEGGAIVSDDEDFIDRCYAYHNFGIVGGEGPVMSGSKLRLSEYQAAIGLAQLKRLDEQTETRIANAGYLKPQLEEIPGILPYKVYDHVTKVVFHLFPFRYKKEEFEGLSRENFIRALRAEGIRCSRPGSGGFVTLNNYPYINHYFRSKNFRRMYSEEELDFDRYVRENRCPTYERLINEEAVWFTQNMLLGERSDMDDIVAGIKKIQRHAGKIRRQIES